MPFFDFRQNNSGGDFNYDKDAGIAVTVIVEADDYREANERAQRIGLYFNGCESGWDCDCCGDRWYAQNSDDEGDPVPSVYGTPLTEFTSTWGGWSGDDPEVWVHTKDGRKFPFIMKEMGYRNWAYIYVGSETLPVTLPAATTIKEIES